MSPLPWPVGQKVVCVNDRFHAQVHEFFDVIPQEGKVYTVRELFWGVEHETDKLVLSVRLTELAPLSGDHEPGFSLWRFRLLEDVKREAAAAARRILGRYTEE